MEKLNNYNNKTIKTNNVDSKFCLKMIIFGSYVILSVLYLISYYLKNIKYDDGINLDYRGDISNNNKKIIVYSCLIGDYDNVINFNKQKGYDYVLFTDQNITNVNWTILPIPKEVQNLNVSDIKKQRYIKINPHKFFKNYDLSIYIDANYIIKGDLNDFLKKILNPLDNIYITHLKFGKDLKVAIKDAKTNKLDNHTLLDTIEKRYFDKRITRKPGIVNAGLIIRKHLKEDCITLMEKWWEEVERYSHVDGFEFNYAAYMTKIRFLYISYQLTLEYFGHNKHLKKIDY